MKAPYLGRLRLRWCKRCNLPLLTKRCAICGEPGESVPITPPGDVRPAFARDVEIINRAAEKQFGTRLLSEDRLAVLNRTPGEDMLDEIIADGTVLGALRYDFERGYVLMPSPAGAQRLIKGGKGYVEVAPDVEPFLAKGASVLLPGVTGFDPEIRREDEVIVTCGGRAIAVGKARMNAEEAASRRKGMFVKVRRYCGDVKDELPGGKSWEDAVKANRRVIENYEREAVRFIREIAEKSRRPVIVAFSGGKDSLATLLLVKKALGEATALVVDTGVEFPETMKFAEEAVKAVGAELLVARAGDRFWRGVEYFGFPGRDYRWCCKVVKLGPTARVIREHFPDGCLTFIGQRRYESETRAASRRVWRNPWLRSQLAASPIQEWTALHVWLFLLKEGVAFNPLYQEGNYRLGCWLCPGSEMAEIAMLRQSHPELWEKLRDVLARQGFSEAEFLHGLWRWRHLPKGQEQLAKKVGLGARRRRVRFRYTIERRNNELLARTRFSAAFEDIAGFARTLGIKTESNDFIEVEGIRFYRGGIAEAVAGDRSTLKEKVRRMQGVIERAEHCLACGVCVAQCRGDAIEIEEKARITERCTSCGACHERCPLVRYLVAKAEVVFEDAQA